MQISRYTILKYLWSADYDVLFIYFLHCVIQKRTNTYRFCHVKVNRDITKTYNKFSNCSNKTNGRNMTSEANLDSPSVITKIRGAEDLIKFGFYRIEAMERQLQSKHLSSEERERIEKELEDCKQELHRNQDILKVLQKENSKSFVLSAILLFLCFLVFGTYKMYVKHNEK